MRVDNATSGKEEEFDHRNKKKVLREIILEVQETILEGREMLLGKGEMTKKWPKTAFLAKMKVLSDQIYCWLSYYKGRRLLFWLLMRRRVLDNRARW